MKKLVGKTVRIISDNENYTDYLNIKLVIVSASNNGYLYDESMYPEYLCDLETIDGKDVPFALYEYEFEVLN